MNDRLDEALKGVWASLTDTQREKVKSCKTAEELMNLARQEGIELPDEALDAVSGGCGDADARGPYVYHTSSNFPRRTGWFDCPYCGGSFLEGERHNCPAKQVPIRQ